MAEIGTEDIPPIALGDSQVPLSIRGSSRSGSESDNDTVIGTIEASGAGIKAEASTPDEETKASTKEIEPSSADLSPDDGAQSGNNNGHGQEEASTKAASEP